MTIVINEFDGFRVEVDNENNRGDIILSRPPLNVIQYSQRIQMAEAMKDLDKNENVRVIILRADGKNFSSGGNIEGFLQETPETLTMLAQNVMTPEKIRKPVIAAIQGYCFGVGLEFSLACDFRIVTKCSRLSLPEMKIGMIPGSGGSVPPLAPPAQSEIIASSKSRVWKPTLSKAALENSAGPEFRVKPYTAPRHSAFQ